MAWQPTWEICAPSPGVSEFNVSYSIFLCSELSGSQWLSFETAAAWSFSGQKSSSGAIQILAESKKLTGGPSTSLGDHSAESQETNKLVQAPLTAVTKLGFIIEFRSQTILGSQGESKFPALQQNYSGKWIQSYLSLWAQKTNFGDLEVSVVDAT